jgi:hypothetical protein
MAWLLAKGCNGELHDPTWTQLQDAIVEMDGVRLNEIEVTLEGIGSLIIGGGDDQRSIVVFLPEGDPEEVSPVTLVDQSLTGPTVSLTVQTRADYPARIAVHLPLVLQVVEQFYQRGKLPEDVDWEP